jgi:hypothetical protein
MTEDREVCKTGEDLHPQPTLAGSAIVSPAPGPPINSQPSAKSYYTALVLLAAISLWMRAGFPVFARPDAVHDDRLFIRLARYLMTGDWLGPYDNLTLAKGMFYSLFITLAHALSIPLKIAEQAVYLAASAAVAGLVRRHAASDRLPIVMFAILAFNPVFWHPDLARVLREGLYVGLSLAVFALAAAIFLTPYNGPAASPLKVLQSVSLGFLTAAFWLTREEGIWLAPAIAVLIAAAIRGVSRTASSSRRRAFLNTIALPLSITLLIFVVTDSLVAVVNFRHYRVFETNEFRAKSFLRAYGALTRIPANEWHRYVLFPEDARQRAYAVSPAARELANGFEGPLAQGWRRASCSSMNVRFCPEVLSGWLMWELRDAVRDAGHYGSAPEAMRFYDKLADQIDIACDDGRLACLPNRPTLSPRFREEYVGETLDSAKAVAQQLFHLGDGRIGSAPSTGAPQGISIFADTVGPVYPPNDLVGSAEIPGAVQLKVASVIASGYATVFPILTIFGIAGLLLTVSLRQLRPFPTALFALSLASAVAICTRIFLLAYIDATSFTAANVPYVSPASPFVIILAAVGIYLGYRTVFHRTQLH